MTRGVQVWGFSGIHQQVPFFWQRICDLWFLQQGSTQSWTVAASETVSLLQVQLKATLLSRTSPLSFYLGDYMLCLIHVAPSSMRASLHFILALSTVPGTKKTVHNYLRKEGVNAGTHHSNLKTVEPMVFARSFVFIPILTPSHLHPLPHPHFSPCGWPG